MSRVRFLLAVALLALATGSCDSEGAVAEDSGPTPGEVPPLAERYEDFDPANFDSTSIDIDNPYLPLAPGTRLVHEGVDIRAGKKVPHRIDFIVTDVTQVVNGVRTVVIWERDFVRNALEEAELTYFAQDIAGNVWHLGQYSEIYEGEEMVGATGFLPGHLDGARAGIMMQADPRPGTPSYSEGYGPPPIYWTDRARVVATGKRAAVPAGKYDDVLVIEEYSEQERTGFQLKHYAPGVGNVRVGWRGEDASRETLELVKVTTLQEAGMERARAAVRKLEQRARQYGSTPPSEVR